MINTIAPLIMQYKDYKQDCIKTINLLPNYQYHMYLYIILRVIYIICFEISLKQIIQMVIFMYYFNENLQNQHLQKDGQKSQYIIEELSVNNYRKKDPKEIFKELKKMILTVTAFFILTLGLQTELSKRRLDLKKKIGLSINDLFLKNLEFYNIYLLEQVQFNKIAHMYFLIEDSMIIYIDSYSGILYSIAVYMTIFALICQESYKYININKAIKQPKELEVEKLVDQLEISRRNCISFLFVSIFYTIGIITESVMYCKYHNYLELFEDMYSHKLLKLGHVIPKFIRETIMYIILPAVMKNLTGITNCWEYIIKALFKDEKKFSAIKVFLKMFAIVFMSLVFAFLIGGIRSKGGDVFISLFLEHKRVINLSLEQCLPPVYKNIYTEDITGTFQKIQINIQRKIKEVDFNLQNLEFTPGINFLNGDTNKIKILLELISGMTTHELLPGEVLVTYIDENGVEKVKDLSLVNDQSISKNVLHIPFSVNIPDTMNIMKFLSLFNNNKVEIEEAAYGACLFPQVRRDQKCSELSGGQKARAKITLMLLYKNSTRYNFNVEIWETLEVGLDYKLKEEMYVPQILNNLQNDKKIKIVISSPLIQRLIEDKLKDRVNKAEI